MDTYRKVTLGVSESGFGFVCESPESEAIAVIAWHQGFGSDEPKMLVVFQSGSMYSYEGVSSALFYELVSAESMGKAYNALVKGKYPAEALPSR